MRIMKVPEGGVKILVQGLFRASVEEILSTNGILSVKLKPFHFKDQQASDKSGIEARIRNIQGIIDSMISSGKCARTAGSTLCTFCLSLI